MMAVYATSAFAQEENIGPSMMVTLSAKTMELDDALDDDAIFSGKRVFIAFKDGRLYEESLALMTSGTYRKVGDSLKKSIPVRVQEGQVNLQGGTYRIMLALSVPIQRHGEVKEQASPYVEMVGIAGKFYRVNVSKDGDTVKLQQVKVETGVLERVEGMDLVAVSDRCSVMLASKAPGKWELPEGKYVAPKYRLTRGTTIKRGLESINTGTRARKSWLSFSIQPDASTVLKAGEPLMARYNVSPFSKMDEPRFVCWLEGQGGEYYQIGVTQGNAKPAQVPFAIITKDGKRVHEGNFDGTSQGSGSWKLPAKTDHLEAGVRFQTKFPGPFKILPDERAHQFKLR